MKDDTSLESLLTSLPKAVKQIKQEADKVGRVLLNDQLKKADVVTREEFVEQQELLKAVLEKLALLEKRIATIKKEN